MKPTIRQYFGITLFMGTMYLMAYYIASVEWFRISESKRRPYLQRKRNDVEDRRDPENIISGIGRDAKPEFSQSISEAILHEALRKLKTESNEMYAQKYEEYYRNKVHIHPIKVIIVSAWRSGSTYLEGIFNSHNLMYNFYEPLMMYGLKRLKKESNETKSAFALIQNLLDCKFTDEAFISTMKKVPEMAMRNTLVYSICNENKNGTDLCFNPKYLSEACRILPWKLIKLVRISLDALEPLLDSLDNDFLRIVLLVRDPRAVISSRLSVDWCQEDCTSPKMLCQDTIDDLKSAVRLEREYPGRISVVTYENMAANPHLFTKSLFGNTDLLYGNSTKLYIDAHMSKESDAPFSTFKKSSNHINSWREKMDNETIEYIENTSECKQLIEELSSYNN